MGGIMKLTSRSLIRCLPALALVVAAGCGSGSSTVATISPTPTAVFDDSYGFLVGNAVRRESDPKILFTLPIGEGAYPVVVSPDGRHLAYEVNNQLRVIDVAPNAQPRTLLTATGKESGFGIAWSSDGTGLVFGTFGPSAPVADVPPSYTAVRVIDAAGGAAREVARIRNAKVVPLTWDRQAHLITAYEPTSMGAGAFDIIDDRGTLKRTNAGPGLYVVEANLDGKHVLGRGDPNTAVRVWPSGSPERGVSLVSTAGDEHIATVAWRPGTSEVGVLFHGDRLELWDANGARRTVTLPAAPTTSDRYASVTFRIDGKAVVVSRMAVVDKVTPPTTYAVAVDLASGRTAIFDWGGVPGGPAISVRIG